MVNTISQYVADSCQEMMETFNFADEAIFLSQAATSVVLFVEVSAVGIAKVLDKSADVVGSCADMNMIGHDGFSYNRRIRLVCC